MIPGNVTVYDLALLAGSLLFSVLFFWVFLLKQIEKKKTVSRAQERNLNVRVMTYGMRRVKVLVHTYDVFP
jgi:hypothetical protein